MVVGLLAVATSVGVPRTDAAGECPAGWTYESGTGTCFRSFTTTGATSWTPPTGVTSISYLVVGAGGGGAGGYSNGTSANGGNGGAVLTSNSASFTAGATLTITVGAGGASTGQGTANSGGASSITGGGLSISAAGATGAGRAGAGANGTTSSFSGTSVIYGSSGGATNQAGGNGAGSGSAPNSMAPGGSGVDGRGGGGGAGSKFDISGFPSSATGGGTGGAGVVMIRYVAFGVSSFTTATTSPTNASSFTYTLTFSASIDATSLTAGDLSNGGNATGCVFTTSPTVGTNTVFTVTVTGCSEGTLVPTLASGSVAPSTGGTGPGAAATGTSLTIDRTAPSAPGLPDMAAGSDLGSSSTDDTTSDTTPTMSTTGGSSGDTMTFTATNGSTTKTCSYVLPATSCDLPTLTDGTWSVSATLTDAAGNVSPASAALPLAVDTTAPSAPVAPDLVAASDLGSSSTDDTTSDNTPAMSLPGATSGDTVTFTATSGATTKTCSYVAGSASSCDLPTLTDGTWSVTAKVTDPAGNQSTAGPALPLVIDTAATSAPGKVDLSASSDLGTSSTDDLTSDTTPTVSAPGGSSGDTMTITATKGVTSESCSYVLPATSCDLPALSDGTWSVSAKLTDPAGNQSTAGTALSMVVDGTAPSAPGLPDVAAASDSGTSSTDNNTSDTTPTMSATGGSSGDTMTFTATNGATTKTCSYVLPATSCDLPALSDGTWSVSSTLTDPAGNVSPASAALPLVVDTTAPSTPVAPDLVAASDTGSSSTDDLTSDTTPALSQPGAASGDTVAFTATNGSTTKTCSYVVGTASSCDLPGLTDGSWSITSRVTDPAGNQSPVGQAFALTVDSAAPSAPGAVDLLASSDSGSSSTDNVTSDTTPAVSATGGSSGDTMTFTATNGSTTVSCSYVVGQSSSCDLPTLTDGTWSVSATLADPAGNQSSAGPALPLTVDSSGPVAASGPDLAAVSDSGSSSTDDTTSDTTPEVSVSGGSTGDRITITATKDGTSLSCSYVVGTASSCDLPTLTDGTWSVSGAVTDPAGNTTAAGTPLSLTIDTASPGVSGVDMADESDSGSSSVDNLTSDSTPKMSIPGQSAGDAVVINATNGLTSVSCSYTVGIATSCDLPALADGTWSVTGLVTDPAGNTAPTTGPLLIAVDSTAPAAPGVPDLVATSDTGASSTDDATNDRTPAVSAPGGVAGETVRLDATKGGMSVWCSYVVGQASSCDLPTLADGTWSVTATFTDAAGNTSAPSAALPIVVDTAAPEMPTRPDLSASSDTGASSTDDVTADSTPLVNVPGVETGASVTVTATKGGTTLTCSYVASATVNGCVLPDLADGTWSVTATATDSRGNTGTTRPLSLVIDTSKPFGNVTPNKYGGTTNGGSTTTVPRGTAGTTTVPRRTTTTTTPRGSSTTVPVPTTTVPPSPLGTPDLRTPSDSGTNAGDDVTNVRNPVVGLDGLSPGDTAVMTATRGSTTITCRYVVGESDGCPLEGLADGEWSVTGAVTDLAGNKANAPGTLLLRRDSSAPVSALAVSSSDDPSDGATFVEVAGAADGETVVVTGTSGGVTVTCSYVAGPDSRGCLLENVEPGSWSVTAVSLDDAGNPGDPSDPLGISYSRPGKGNNGGGEPGSLPDGDTIRLLASALALLAIGRRRDEETPERLSDDEREVSGTAEYSAGSGSGGLAVRDDLYVPPNIAPVDDGFCSAALRSAPLSPVVARSLDDGSYLRALFGVAWPLLPLASLVLAVMAAADTSYEAVLPALGIFVALVVIGTLDAFAGLLAAVTYGVALLLGGGLDSADAVRGYLGIAGTMFLVGLVASAMRPFRRVDGEMQRWNRLVDLVLISLVGAWAAGTMFQAIPFLSGYETAWSGRTGTVELAALITLVVRYALENAARLSVATRLTRIENEELPEPGDTQQTFSRLARTALFAFVAVVFIGANWWLAAGTLMFLVPKLVDHRADGFPNSETLYRYVPRNLPRIVAMLLVMLWWGLLVDGSVSANTVQWAFVLMGVPGLVLGAVDWFAREGDDWPSTVVSRVLGAATLVLGVALVRGWWP